MPLPGDPIRLSLELGFSATNKFVRAYLLDASGNPLSGQETFNLLHTNYGNYVNNTPIFPMGTPEVKVIYVVFNDSGYTQRSRVYPTAYEKFNLPEGSGGQTIIINQQNLVGIIVDGDAVLGVTESTNNLLGLLDQDNLVIGGLVNGGVVGGILIDDDELAPEPVPTTNQTIQGNLLC